MYDFIIVGAGSGGCALAYYLHKKLPAATILIVEAGGGNDDIKVHDFTKTDETYGPEFSWQLKSTKQTALNDREMPYTCGRTDGGSGSINGMVCVKPHPKDTMMRYLDNDVLDDVCKKFIPSSFFSQDNLSKNVLNSLKQMGFPYMRDYVKNNSTELGVAFTRLNVSQTGERLDPYLVFLNRIMRLKHKISILNNAKVDKLIIQDNRVTGIILNGKDRIHAKKEVILCAGAVHTPKILLRSGIGPKKLLSDNNITLKKDLPVGENLHDQLITYAVRPLVSEYLDGAKAPMTISAFFNRTNIKLEPDFKFIPGDPTLQPEFQIQTFILKNGWGTVPPNSFVVGIIHLHPKSRGSVSLPPKEEKHGEPIINPNCLSAKEDQEDLIYGQKVANSIIDALPKELFTKERIAPEKSKKSDKELLEYIKETAVTDFHPAGTCSINLVVDDKFCVKGIENLRIADASVICEPVSGNPQVTTCAVGLKAAQHVVTKYKPVENQTMLQPSVSRNMHRFPSSHTAYVGESTATLAVTAIATQSNSEKEEKSSTVTAIKKASIS